MFIRSISFLFVNYDTVIALHSVHRTSGSQAKFLHYYSHTLLRGGRQEIFVDQAWSDFQGLTESMLKLILHFNNCSW